MTEYTKQEKPLYGFYVNKEGRIVRAEYHDYTITRKGYSNTKHYHFSNGARKVIKTEDQLDRYLNGYLYTFNPSHKRAYDIIKNTLKKHRDEAEARIAAIGKMLDIIDPIM